MKKPMYGFHTDGAGKVLTTSSFDHEFELANWLRGLDIRPGDKLEFFEITVRPEFDEVSISPAPPAPPANPTDDDLTF